MSEEKLHHTPVIKQGTGERIFLAFAGRRNRSSDPPELSAKSHIAQELIGLLLLVMTASMIGIVLWHFLSGNR